MVWSVSAKAKAKEKGKRKVGDDEESELGEGEEEREPLSGIEEVGESSQAAAHKRTDELRVRALEFEKLPKIPKKRTEREWEEEKRTGWIGTKESEEDLMERVMAKVISKAFPSLQEVAGKVERTEHWQEATTRFQDIELSDSRNKNEYNLCIGT